MRHRPSFEIPAGRLRFAVGLLCVMAVAMLVPSGAGAAQGGVRCEDVSFSVNLFSE